MIFVTVGSQKFQFNRLLKEIDRLIEIGEIKEEVFAQIGYSDYVPKNYKYKKFLNRDEFLIVMKKCDKVITHGGTGAIISAVKNLKKVIAIPRSSSYKEHVDEHQFQIVKEFEKTNIIMAIYTIDDLGNAIKKLENKTFNKYESNTQKIEESILEFIIMS